MAVLSVLALPLCPEKSLGASDRSIRKIFLYNATYIIGLGLLWGNILGFLLLWLQQRYSIIKLDPATYYVNEVPIAFILLWVILLNIGVLLLCLLMLLIPTYVITKISPTRQRIRRQRRPRLAHRPP